MLARWRSEGGLLCDEEKGSGETTASLSRTIVAAIASEIRNVRGINTGFVRH